MKFSPGVERVIEHVKSTKGWELRGTMLRLGAWTCPLASWRNTHNSDASYYRFAVVQGLTGEEIDLVADAADLRFGSFTQRALRAALLEAAGLQEPA